MGAKTCVIAGIAALGIALPCRKRVTRPASPETDLSFHSKSDNRRTLTCQ